MTKNDEHTAEVALSMAIGNHSTIIALITELKKLGLDIDVDAVKKQSDERAVTLKEEIKDILNK